MSFILMCPNPKPISYVPPSICSSPMRPRLTLLFLSRRGGNNNTLHADSSASRKKKFYPATSPPQLKPTSPLLSVLFEANEFQLSHLQRHLTQFSLLCMCHGHIGDYSCRPRRFHPNLGLNAISVPFAHIDVHSSVYTLTWTSMPSSVDGHPSIYELVAGITSLFCEGRVAAVAPSMAITSISCFRFPIFARGLFPLPISYWFYYAPVVGHSPTALPALLDSMQRCDVARIFQPFTILRFAYIHLSGLVIYPFHFLASFRGSLCF